MYSDFFDPPQDVEGGKGHSDADKVDEGMEYNSDDDDDDDRTAVSEEELSDSNDKTDKTDDNDDADDSAADDEGKDAEQPPEKKARHKLFADK